MAEAPAVSIIMPVFNHEPYVGAAIQSVLDQSLANIELIVIDDGSTDRSLAIARSFTDSRISVTAQSNVGSGKTINRGIAYASAPFISIINSDDIYAPNRLATLFERCESGRLSFAVTDVKVIDEKGRIVEQSDHWWIKRHQAACAAQRELNDARQALLFGNFTVSTSNFFFRRELIDRIGGFRNLRNVQDWNFAFRAAVAEPHNFVAYLDDQLLYYRLHGQNTILEASSRGALEEAHFYESAVSRLYGQAASKGVRRVAFNHRGLRRAVQAHATRLQWRVDTVEDEAKRLRAERDTAQEEAERLRAERDTAQQNLHELRISRTYRLGWTLTYLPRVIRAGLRRLRGSRRRVD